MLKLTYDPTSASSAVTSPRNSVRSESLAPPLSEKPEEALRRALFALSNASAVLRIIPQVSALRNDNLRRGIFILAAAVDVAVHAKI